MLKILYFSFFSFVLDKKKGRLKLYPKRINVEIVVTIRIFFMKFSLINLTCNYFWGLFVVDNFINRLSKRRFIKRI